MSDIKINLADTEAPDQGYTIVVCLPGGLEVSMWVFHSDITTSVDVSASRGEDRLTLDHVIHLPSSTELRTAAVVIENRKCTK